MNKFLQTALVSAFMATLPAAASEVGLILDKQFGSSQPWAYSFSAPDGSFSQSFTGDISSVKPTGFGIRGAYTLVNLGVAEIGLNGTYHAQTKSDLTWSGSWSSTTIGNGSGSSKWGEYKDSYLAIGAQADWKFLVNLHAGLEIRRETLTTSSTSSAQVLSSSFGAQSFDTTITRPWVSVGAGISIPTPVISPFVRLDISFATTNSSKFNLTPSPSKDDFNKSLAPKYQIALYGGIRF